MEEHDVNYGTLVDELKTTREQLDKMKHDIEQVIAFNKELLSRKAPITEEETSEQKDKRLGDKLYKGLKGGR